jgi:uncharacterized protein
MRRSATFVSAAMVAGAALAAPSFPALTGWVVDRAGVIDDAAERRIANASEGLERRTGHQFVVTTVPTLEGASVERYSRALFNHWGIGRNGVNDGVGLLVAPGERKVRIEVGYGLERRLTDRKADEIITRDILPAYRAGRMSQGTERGAMAIIREIS